MLVKDVVKCIGINDRIEIKQDGCIVWRGHVKDMDKDNHSLIDKECLIIEPFCNENSEFGTRLTIEDSIKIDDSFKIDKDITVGELVYNYMSDTTVIRIVELSGVFLENEEFIYEEFIYEEYAGEWERKDLLNKRAIGVDCFAYGTDEAGIIIFI